MNLSNIDWHTVFIIIVMMLAWFVPDMLILKNEVGIPRETFAIAYPRLAWIPITYIAVFLVEVSVLAWLGGWVVFPRWFLGPFGVSSIVLILLFVVHGLPRAIFEIAFGVSCQSLGRSINYLVGPRVYIAGFVRLIMALIAIVIIIMKKSIF